MDTQVRSDEINARLEQIYAEISETFEQAKLVTTSAARSDLVFSARMNALEAEKRILMRESITLEGFDPDELGL